MAATELIALSSIPDGGFAETGAMVDGSMESLILHRRGPELRAWVNVCPHAGRRLDWAPGEFLRSKAGELVCAVHGATFALGDGRCVGGPCVGAHLRAVPVTVRDGEVLLGDGDAPA